MKQSPKPAKQSPRSEPRLDPWLVAAPGLTMLLRIWFILSMRGTPFSHISPQLVDPWYYHRWALEILGGNLWGSDVFFLRPLYPYLLAGVYRIFGVSVLPVQLLQALMSVVSCALLYTVTRRLFSRAAARFAAFGFALCGILVFYSGTLLYVELTTLLSLLLVWLLLIAGRRLWLWLTTGLVFGLLVVCRPEFLILLPPLIVWLARRHTRPRSIITMSLVALAVVASVPVRNYLVARDPVLFTAHSGVNFYYGNNPNADGTWQPTAELERGTGFSHERMRQQSRTIDGRVLRWSQASSHWLQRGLSFIASRPLRWLRLEVRKLLLFCSDYEVPNDYYLETARAASVPLRLSFLTFGPILALGLLGIVWAWRARTKALPVLLFACAHLLSALLFYVLSRLRAPAIPFLLAFAGFACAGLVRLFRERKAGRALTGIAIAAVVFAGSLLIPIDRRTYTAQAWTQAGNTWAAMQRPNRAVDAFTRALAARPDNLAARYGLLMADATLGRAQDAEAEFARLAPLARGTALGKQFLLLSQARLAVMRRNFPAAASLYHEAVASDSTEPEAPYLLGLVYVSMDSLVPARAWLGRSLVLNPGDTAIQTLLSRVEARLGGN